jgi:hypothetical protein
MDQEMSDSYSQFSITPNSSNPTSSPDEEAQMKVLMETVKAKGKTESSVAAWLLQDLNSHKERLIKGQYFQ